MKTAPLRSLAAVWSSSVDKHTVEGESPVQLCNYVDVYKNDKVRPGADSMRASATREEIARNRLLVGDTIFTKDSEDPTDIGISAYVDSTAEDFVCGYHLAIARPFPEVHPRYLTWALRARPTLDHFTNAARGISRYGLGLSDIKATPVPAHATEEQRRIADFLDERVARIDQIIAARQAQNAATDAFYRERVRVLTTTGVGLPRLATGIPWMPEMRKDATLWRVAQSFITASGTTPKSDQTDYYDGSVPWITTSELRDGPISAAARGVSLSALSDYSALSKYPPGTLLIAMYGATVGRLGQLQIEACVNQACCALLERGPVLSEFAFFWFYAHRPQILTLASGGGQPNISQDVVRSLRIPAPSLDEQARIVSDLSALWESVEAGRRYLNTSVKLLQEYKQSLITAAVTGNLDVTAASTKIPGE